MTEFSFATENGPVSFEIDNSEHAFSVAINSVVQERGADYVYDRPFCMYTVTTENGFECACLIGHVLHAIGVPILWLVANEHKEADVLLGKLGFSVWVKWAALAAQRAQDNRNTWGDALKRYNMVIRAFDTSELI